MSCTSVMSTGHLQLFIYNCWWFQNSVYFQSIIAEMRTVLHEQRAMIRYEFLDCGFRRGAGEEVNDSRKTPPFNKTSVSPSPNSASLSVMSSCNLLNRKYVTLRGTVPLNLSTVIWN